MIPYFFYGSGVYSKHPNHTYGRNRNNSANNRAYIQKYWALIVKLSIQKSSLKVYMNNIARGIITYHDQRNSVIGYFILLIWTQILQGLLTHLFYLVPLHLGPNHYQPLQLLLKIYGLQPPHFRFLGLHWSSTYYQNEYRIGRQNNFRLKPGLPSQWSLV